MSAPRAHPMTGARPTRARLLAIAAVIAFVAAIAGCRATTPAADTTAPDERAAQLPPALIAACCPQDDASIMALMRRFEATAPDERPPELAILPYRLTSGITRAERIVVEDAAAWERLWPELLRSHSPAPLPRVDFAREAIVVATMGQRATGGYTISIDGAQVAGDTITLVVTSRSPGRTCGTTAALSSPMALARVTRPRVPIRFVERAVVTDCG